jgi:AraC-like DNA-binding protein
MAATGDLTETSEFWRHPRFADLGLLKARFTRHRYELHTHPTYVIALITAGCERIRIGRETVVAPAGTVAIVNPEECHNGEAGADGGWAYRTFYPPVSLFDAIARELGQDRTPMFGQRLVEDASLARALALAHRASATPDATSAETLLLVAFRHLICRYGDGTRSPTRIERGGSRRRVALYAEFVEGNLETGLDLQSLADTAGVTRFQVIRDFKAATGLTPASFIRDRRLRRADRLIAQGLGLAEAALAAGFADQSHLSRTFRATRGMTPGTFQKGWRDN